ncbi:unnamed protein product [Somion occarium]|uniref:Uncharacterized protein n=1 Tax=Somion occarium TaxID=3059160 RepID=A0ABP1CIN9_9APHY
MAAVGGHSSGGKHNGSSCRQNLNARDHVRCTYEHRPKPQTICRLPGYSHLQRHIRTWYISTPIYQAFYGFENLHQSNLSTQTLGNQTKILNNVEAPPSVKYLAFWLTFRRRMICGM